MLRSGYEQTLAIDARNLDFVDQGFEPAADTSHCDSIPSKLGLLAQVP